MALNLGGVIRLTYAVKNDLGVLTNPSSATLTITQPDGTTATPTVTLPPAVTGQLVVDFAPAQAGLHQARWLTTSPITSEPDAFYAATNGTLLISVDEAINHLRATSTISSDPDRETMQDLCLAVSGIIPDDLSRDMVRRTVTQSYNGGSAIILRSSPVLSITSVTESGTLLTGSDYFVDPAGILRRGTTTSSMSFASGYGNITVVYQVGYADPPWAARMMAKWLVQAFWQTSQQAPHPLLDESVAFEALPGLLSGAPEPLRRAYNKLRVRGTA